MKHLILLFLVLPTQLFAQEFSIRFDTNSAEANQSQLSNLQKWLSQNAANDELIQIIGFTDSRGNAEYNYQLSLARAEFVRSFLVNEGFQIHQSSGEGENNVILRNNQEDLELSRRVVVSVVQLSKNKDAQTEPAVRNDWDLEKLRAYLAPAEEVHCINNRKDTLLSLNKGSHIFIKSYCFSDYDAFRCVNINVVEAHDRADMLFAGLETKSDGSIIQSGGMIKIQATQDGKELEVNEDKPLTVFLPESNPDPRMRLFYSDDDGRDWHEQSGEDGKVWPLYGDDLSDYFAGFNPKNQINREKCRFFWCRIKRGFQKKEKRSPMDEDGFLISMRFEEGWDSELTEQMMEAFGAESVEEFNRMYTQQKEALDELNFYSFQSSRLGWINCDFFPGQTREPLIIANTPHSDRSIFCDVKMIFNKENVVMRGSQSFEGFDFVNVPEKRDIKLVGIGVKDGQPCLAMEQTPCAAELPNLSYTVMSADELKSKVKQFIKK